MRPAAIILALLILSMPIAQAAADYQVFYSEKQAAFHGNGAAGIGETRGFRFAVAQMNVTYLEFILTWTETGDSARLSGPDVFSLSATDPSGRPVGSPMRSATGEARIETRRIAPLPPDRGVSASELDAVLTSTSSDAGHGSWMAYVKLESAGNPEGTSFDKGNDFDLVAIVHYYEGVPMRVVSLGKPDTPLETFVPPGGWPLALIGMGAVAVALGGIVVAQIVRKRMSPRGETAPLPGR